MEFIADANQVDPDKPFYLHLCFGASHAPHHVPKEWADKYADASTTAGMRHREYDLRPPVELGIVPADASFRATTPTCPTGTRFRLTPAASTAG